MGSDGKLSTNNILNKDGLDLVKKNEIVTRTQGLSQQQLIHSKDLSVGPTALAPNALALTLQWMMDSGGTSSSTPASSIFALCCETYPHL
ncbi:hypothetical protein V6N11_068003 [Hibiscus sabdariffa]|uniref:Uncharacterized protein n=1 Tax=Hibiscus sabdariffa TaxID=183260 RepID=A0ABR2STE6_9ROSI